jgi:hypothetical protein
MDVMIEFMGGGPLDGKVLASDEIVEFDANKAKWMLNIVGASLDIAARKEEKPGTLLIWRMKSPQMAEQAKAERWSEAKVAAMPHHEYHITKFEETDGLVLFKAYYRGIDV